jgi:lysozyme family protein
MATVRFTPALQAEYQQLFDGCLMQKPRAAEIDATVQRIARGRPRYEAVGTPLDISWFVVGLIHCMEASLNFATHLHNGDPLTARTVHVPAGRPRDGTPPFTWEDSASDALCLRNLHKWSDWSLPGTLYQLEGYNGFGYRLHHPEVRTPYLWSGSNWYASGKYVADGTWSPSAVSKQCGAAVLLRRMAEINQVVFMRDGGLIAAHPDTATATPDAMQTPLVTYSKRRRSDVAAELQRALNRFPGIFVKVDGIPGDLTSAAFKRLSGCYLQGDPRALNESNAV